MDKKTKDRTSTGIAIDQRVDKVAYMREWRALNRDHCSSWRRNYRRSEPEKHMLVRAKVRAAKLGLPCNISEEDIIIPAVCPILGLKLETGTANRNAAPSLDRINSSEGYVKGNVAVISNLANSLKSNMTLAQIVRMAEWAKEQQDG